MAGAAVVIVVVIVLIVVVVVALVVSGRVAYRGDCGYAIGLRMDRCPD